MVRHDRHFAPENGRGSRKRRERRSRETWRYKYGKVWNSESKYTNNDVFFFFFGAQKEHGI